MLMYFYVHCAFFFLKSYYMTHSPPFLEKVYNGRLVRCLRVKSVLTYFYVGFIFPAALNALISIK